MGKIPGRRQALKHNGLRFCARPWEISNPPRKVSSYLVLFSLVAGGLITLPASGKAQEKKKFEPVQHVRPIQAEPVAATEAAPPVRPQSSTYQIGTGDVLEVNVWREPEISQKLVVRPDGMISLPLVGDVTANGQTSEGLAQDITAKLKSYLTSPQVTIIVVEVRSKWYVTVGEVDKPGTYPLARPITVMEALSQVGGFREFAKTNKIYVLRQVNGKTVRLAFHYNRVVKGKDSSENIEVHNGDTIVVP